MKIERLQMSIQTVKENIAILESQEPEDAGYYLQLEHEKMVLDALKKQMPKHIEEQTEDDREFIDYVCPNCKTTLQQKMKGAKRTTIYKYKHCIFCGQSLDWSDHPTEKRGVE